MAQQWRSFFCGVLEYRAIDSGLTLPRPRRLHIVTEGALQRHFFVARLYGEYPVLGHGGEGIGPGLDLTKPIESFLPACSVVVGDAHQDDAAQQLWMRDRQLGREHSAGVIATEVDRNGALRSPTQ